MKYALLLALAACGGKPIVDDRTPFFEVVSLLDTGPGNIAITDEQRIFVSQHQFYAPEDPVVEVIGNTTKPFAATANVKSVLGIRADEHGIVWMLDNGMRAKTTRQLVGWNVAADRVEMTIDLTGASHDDSFLNDLAVDRTHDAVYISDPASGTNAAIIVVDLATRTARRVLEGADSVIPTPIDLVIDNTKIEAHVGVNPIALDKKDEWLYFGPMHGTTLYRARTNSLRDASITPPFEIYATRPITDGISIDNDGNIYLGDLANNAIGVIDTERNYRELARNWIQLSWIDAFCFAPDGYYYVVANQLHRSAPLNGGVDATKKPFRILRFKPLAPGHVGR